ncbi:MAG TPA: acetate--CoA ligase family protein [Alphaproteobacteria bacterium]|nr:acetate--CoA ligase family protein [Alphaproteobacteria bacterium]
MNMKPLDLLFAPRSIALIGASPKDGSLGKALMKNIIDGGYEGTIFSVNPKYAELLGPPYHPTIKTLPSVPDLAILCTPATLVPALIADIGKKGTKVAVVISAGFGEGGEEGIHLQDAMLEAAKIHGVRIIGPNCLGIINTHVKLNATFSTLSPKKGSVAFITQSGALLVSMMEWAHTQEMGFSKLVSVGGMSDLHFADFLKYLEDDPETNAIILYIEAITDAARFLSIAKETVVKKPVAVMKSGRFKGAAKAVRSHSGALAGSDAVYEAAFRQAGLCRLYELQDVYDLFLTMSHLQKLKGDKLAILTNGGGLGILATDALIATGRELSSLSSSTINKLNIVLPPTWSQGNPVDIIGDAPPERYASALKILMDDPSLHAILLIHCPTSLSPAEQVFEILNETIHTWKRPRPDIFMVSLQQNVKKKILTQFVQNKIPIYPTPERAVGAFSNILRCESEARFIDKSPLKPIKVEAKVTKILKQLVKKQDQEWLDHHVNQEILSSYDIPVIRTEFASSPSEAKLVSQKMMFPVVLKIASEDIIHKSDIGGVILNLTNSEEVEKAAKKMLSVIAIHNPKARIDGFIMQPMIPLDHGFELFLGGVQDKTFGPVVIFGAGGKAVEVINDKALALAPLSHKSAMDLIEKTKIYNQLKGYRDQPPIPLDQLIECLIKISYVLVNHSEIAELDINPLLTDSKRILVLDSRMRLTLPST